MKARSKYENNILRLKKLMSNSIKIYKRDIKTIMTNYVTFIIILGLIALPSLYAWFNIKACWDPYSNTKGLLVAVVDKDKGSEYKNIKVQAGKDIENKLKGNDKIGWKFVSEQDATAGVKNGKYYASITITENFSENLLSIAKQDIPKKAELIYSVNEKKNAIATKITDKGTSSLQEEISRSFIQTASDSALLYLNQVGMDLEKNRPALKKLVDTIINLDDKMPEIKASIDNAYDGSVLIQQYIQNIQGNMPVLSDSINKTLSIAKNNDNKLKQVQDSMNKVSATVNSDYQFMVETDNNIKNFIGQIQGLKSTDVDSIISSLKFIRDSYTIIIEKTDECINLLNNIKNIVDNVSNGSTLGNKVSVDLITAISKLTKIRNNAQVQLGYINSIINSVENNKDYITTGLPGDLNTALLNANKLSSDINNNMNEFNNETIPAIRQTSKDLVDLSGDSVVLLQSSQMNLPLVDSLLKAANTGTSLSGKQLKDVQNQLPDLQKDIHENSQQLKAIESDGKFDEIVKMLNKDAKLQSEFLSEPINLSENHVYPIPNYGSAMSPFYSTLAIWVGAFVLLSLLSVHVKPFQGEGKLSPREQFFGRYMTFATIAIIQALVVAVGDMLLLGTYVASPIIYVIYSVYVSIVFTMIIYTLVTVFGNIGKAIAMVAMVLQVSSSGGTFPVELIPPFFQSLNPILPFTYSIGGMRETVGGILIEPMINNTIYLAIFFVAFMLIGIFLKERLNRINKKFIEQFKESGLAE